MEAAAFHHSVTALLVTKKPTKEDGAFLCPKKKNLTHKKDTLD